MKDTHRALIDQMTLEEKASLMSGANFWNSKGIDRLGIPSMMLTDGPHGLRKQGGSADHLGLNQSLPATCFPTAATLANSWDPHLGYEVGQALGVEAKAEGVSVLLGPGLNIKRNPLAGRNFEYFSEDPLLAGKMAAALIRGIQSEGVGASMKHYAVNSQEKHRMSIDEVVDERALHETYLEGFRIAVQEGNPYTVMSSYNKVNGDYTNENQPLMEILRNEWGFDGLVVTDWGGNNDRVAGLLAGNALEMPSTGGITDAEIVVAVQDGSLDETVLDARVAEVLELIDRTAATNPALADLSDVNPDFDGHHDLAVRAAEEGVVLLKNGPTQNPTLPLRRGSSVAVIGDFADDLRIQGAGSSRVNPTRTESPLDALSAAGLNLAGFAQGFKRHGGRSDALRKRALALASRAETTIVFIGLDESLEAEAADRPHMRIPREQLRLLHDLLAAGHKPIVILVGGSPMELPFADHVDAILAGYLPGQGGASAIANVLVGAVNPSGKLAETYPVVYEDVPSAPTYGNTEAASYHDESIYIGYRYFDKVGGRVRFPFGHGLSYTTFEYSNLQVDAEGVSVTVTNTGTRAGTEVVQVYVGPPETTDFVAPQQLAGFARVTLEAGESTSVRIDFSEHAFSVFDGAAGKWRQRKGLYAALVGASSRDIRLEGTVEVDGEEFDLNYDRDLLPHYFSGEVKGIGASEFAHLLGRTPPSQFWDRSLPITRDSILAQLVGRGGIAGLCGGAITGIGSILHAVGKPMLANNMNFALDMPLRTLPRLSGGAFTESALDDLINVLNGRLPKGNRTASKEAGKTK